MEQEIIRGLIARGMSPHMAQGAVANMIAESRLDPGINEISPLVAGSRGGYGLNQWTGARRRAYEAYAAARGVPFNDLETQLDFTMEEMRGPERSAWAALQGAQNAEDAARIYSEKFLRPGIPHLENRISHARRLAGGAPEGGYGKPDLANGAPPRPGLPARPEWPGENALARPEIETAQLDARAFMRERNALAPMSIGVGRRNVLGRL